MNRIVAVTSGKGGVGKTHLSVNLALHCGRAGLRTCVFDADLGLANANLLLKLSPQRTLADVLAGRCGAADIVQSAFGVDVIPGSSGADHMADLAPAAFARLGSLVDVLAGYDMVVVDTASGVADNVLAFVAAAPEVLLVITPEPTALTDAYALVKLLQRRGYAGQIRVVVNQAASERQALHTYEKFREVVRVYQGLDLPLLGTVPDDPRVTEAVGAQMPVSALQAQSPAALAFGDLTAALLRAAAPAGAGQALETFWERLTGRPRLPLRTGAAPADGRAAEAAPAPSMDTLAARVGRLEARVAELADALRAHRDTSPPRVARAAPAPAPAESASESEFESAPSAPVALTSMKESAAPRRRSGEASAGGRGLRAVGRATPIDALQLRRVVGRMLVKALPEAGAEPSDPDRFTQVAVDQLQLENDNEFSLRPGRYTRISLHCAHIESPDRFIEEIFTNCAITGCKVRHLGSHVRYWLTSGRDGCILLDGAVGQRNCVQVYMAAGGNGPLETAAALEQEAVPRLRRSAAEAGTGATLAALLGKFPHEQVTLGEGEEAATLYRMLRRDRPPLLCAFHCAVDTAMDGALRERL